MAGAGGFQAVGPQGAKGGRGGAGPAAAALDESDINVAVGEVGAQGDGAKQAGVDLVLRGRESVRFFFFFFKASLMVSLRSSNLKGLAKK